MHAFTALLAADHLQDLLREAEDERRRQLVRSVQPKSPARALGVRRGATWLVRRLRRRPTGIDRPQPAAC